MTFYKNLFHSHSISVEQWLLCGVQVQSRTKHCYNYDQPLFVAFARRNSN